MPRNGSGVASKPPGTTAVPNTTVESAKYNSTIDDIYALLNDPLPITAGGTGASTKQGAIDGIFDGIAVIDDADLRISDPADRTKIVRLDAGRVTTGTVRVMNAPDRDINISSVPRGHISGLTLSNNATDAVNDIDIAPGEAADDGALPWCMVLSSVLTKRLDAVWAVGSGNGGRDTAAAIANDTYHVFLIQRSDTGVVDALFSLSATAPTMPANYDRKRRIGSIIRSGGTILAFTQRGDHFDLVTSQTDRSSTAAQSLTLLTLSVPTGIVVEPKITMTQQQNAVGNVQTRVASAGDPILSGTVTTAAGEVDYAFFNGGIFTDTSGRIQFSVTIFSGSVSLNALGTKGWIDQRGQ
ncbi:hypothetical protein O9X81_05175 [Agrobacterium salinitolerans]|uniref:hypothetical protein n=1 Tax=Agrobacterium salinitolerans TaxID=1183413 RepID=UPI0022B84E86|nr:hypothetical protein [Agrobacterium salinitolerans]MCZ7855998.1 hypothetical protein [Agrobacterium salinitolerans]